MKQFVTPDVGVTFIPGVNLVASSVTGGGATGEFGGGGQED